MDKFKSPLQREPTANCNSKRYTELRQSGWYWWRSCQIQRWQIMYIANPKRLTYGMVAFEFVGPIPEPENE